MKGGRSVIPVIDKKTEGSYTESTSLLKNKNNQEVIIHCTSSCSISRGASISRSRLGGQGIPLGGRGTEGSGGTGP